MLMFNNSVNGFPSQSQVQQTYYTQQQLPQLPQHQHYQQFQQFPTNPVILPPNYYAIYNYPFFPNCSQHPLSHHPLSHQPLSVYYPTPVSATQITHYQSGLHPGYTSPILFHGAPALVDSRKSSITSNESSPKLQKSTVKTSSTQTSVLPQSYYLNKVWRADGPLSSERQNIKLPSISDIPDFKMLNSKYKIKKPLHNSVPKPVSRLKSDPKPAFLKKRIKQHSVSKTIKYSKSLVKPTIKVFKNKRITESFLLTSLRRDIPSGKFQLNPSVPSYEVEITEDDILRFRVYEFLFDHLNMNDAREEYQKRKEEGGIDGDLDLNEGSIFKVKISIELQDSKIHQDIGKYQSKEAKDIKILQIELLLVKPNLSKLAKSDILETLQLHFSYLFTDDPSDDRYESITKPKWGLGSRDELSVFELTVSVN